MADVCFAGSGEDLDTVCPVVLEAALLAFTIDGSERVAFLVVLRCLSGGVRVNGLSQPAESIVDHLSTVSCGVDLCDLPAQLVVLSVFLIAEGIGAGQQPALLIVDVAPGLLYQGAIGQRALPGLAEEVPIFIIVHQSDGPRGGLGADLIA